MRLRFPLVTRRRLDAALAEIDSLRRRVLATEARHDEVEGKRRNLARWLAESEGQRRILTEDLAAVTIVNGCLTEDLTEVRGQLTESAVAELRAQVRAEKRRADRLQEQYDDAVGLGGKRPLDSSTWQPGYVAPKPDPKPGVAS